MDLSMTKDKWVILSGGKHLLLIGNIIIWWYKYIKYHKDYITLI